MSHHWTAADLKTLRRLREGFLQGTAGAADYWQSTEELALYDRTFAERIGWKWDAVLRELLARGWEPQSQRVLDWGCGSGVAGRRVLTCWPHFSKLSVHDRSTRAMDFAVTRAREEFRRVATDTTAIADAGTLLVLSHVLSELDAKRLAQLLAVAQQAGEIVWVEAGTHAESRRLIEARETLLASGFEAVAPCTHSARCGMLAPENARHWCHHFATPPSEVFQDAAWREFGLELGIDLRALPYSFVVLQRPRAAAATPPDFSRVIGEPREFKGHDKVLSCQAAGVTELMLQKRDAPEIMRELHKGVVAPVYRWTLNGQKIVAGERLVP